jgi:hypothetical protein
MAPTNLYNLKVQKVEQVCLFELSWGQGQRLTAQVDFKIALTQLYQDWRRAYMNFYQSLPSQSQPLRGRKVDGGVAAVPNDWQALLVKAEARLMYEFNHWLQSAELYKIRSTIALAKVSDKIETDEIFPIQLFLTCASIELERFPWEAWELETEFGAGAIQIIRAPLNVATQTYQGQVNRRPRILAILGDETGLDFQAERNALQLLFRVADVQLIGWQPGQTPTQVVEQITNAIADGSWDVLFFAGHSNESEMTGGEISVAPKVSVSISQIAQKLTAACERGLQVAIFNSCSGLNIANTLIDLGLSQVIVMREPVHNRVATEYMVKFLQGLAKHLNVYESMLEASRYLRTEKNFAYPSSYLVPSLFCHPGATLFRIPASKRWQEYLRQILPSPVEAIIIVSTLTLGILTPVQKLLLDGRLYIQAAYRDVTKQIPSQATPPVALVEIDTESISKSELEDSELRPINRTYIAKLMEHTRKLNASIIALDFVIDTPQKNIPTADKNLRDEVNHAVNQNIWIIFATILDKNNKELIVNEVAGIKSNLFLQAYTEAPDDFIELPDVNSGCRKICPISYLMALVHTANQEITQLSKPQIDAKVDLRTQLLDEIYKKQPRKSNLSRLQQLIIPLGLTPLIDFSIPPKSVYTPIPAWKLMKTGAKDSKTFPLISKQIVLIAAGDDGRLGMEPGQSDRIPAPSAIKYWTNQSSLTGGESLAYMTHHFLNRRLVIPIPDILMIGVAIIISKMTVLILENLSLLTNKLRLKILTGSAITIIIYGIVALQVYITAAILVPWILPSSVFLAYILSTTQRKNHA